MAGASSCPVEVRVGEAVTGAPGVAVGGTLVAVGVRVTVGEDGGCVGRGVAVLVAPMGRKVGTGALTPTDVAVGTGVDSPAGIRTNGV
jgi:hypothetical protein